MVLYLQLPAAPHNLRSLPHYAFDAVACRRATGEAVRVTTLSFRPSQL
jgi:hypothetical protein